MTNVAVLTHTEALMKLDEWKRSERSLEADLEGAEDKSNTRLIKAPEWFTKPENRFSALSTFVRKEFDNIVEAQAYAGSLNVQTSFGRNLPIANMVNEMLTQLAERRLGLPEIIEANANAFIDYGSKARLIPAKTVEKTIYINPLAATWNDPVQAAAQLYAAYFWSTPHPLHPLYHEAGHIMLGTSGEAQRLLTPRQATLALAVSTRAKVDEEEFVCEVFAGLLSEVEYDADILRLYKRLGGKKP